MTAVKFILKLIVVALFVFAMMCLMPVRSEPKPSGADTPAPFDHSQCQYPARTTNPPNGCDNSDPCDPLQTKGGSGDCKDSAPPTAAPKTDLTPMEGK